MTRPKILISICLLSLFFAFSAKGQQYPDFEPLHFGQQHTYLYHSDSIWVLEVDSASVNLQGDSVFWSNTIAVNKASSTGNPGWSLGNNNLFLRQMVRLANGQYLLQSVNNDLISINTQAPEGSTFPFYQAGNITATYSYDSSATTFGQADTVMTLTTSDNNQLFISKKHGIIGGVDLRVYCDTSFVNGNLQVWREPGPGFAQSEFFDFEVGDRFGFYTETPYAYMYNQEIWERWDVLSKNAQPDTLIFGLQKESLAIDYYLGDTSYTGFYPSNLKISRVPGRPWNLPTYAWDSNSALLNVGASWDVSKQRTSQTMEVWNYDTLQGGSLVNFIDYFRVQVYQTGLGETFDGTYSFTDYITVLECWSTQVDNHLPCPDLGNGVGVSEKLAMKVEVYPNPVVEELQVEITQGTGEAVSFQLVDLLGRAQLQGRFSAKGGRLNLEKLPAGTYFLCIENMSKALKIIRQ